jgi:hypothetical protein
VCDRQHEQRSAAADHLDVDVSVRASFLLALSTAIY